MQQRDVTQEKITKVYKAETIWLGTILGGPLVAGYLISQNFKVFGEYEKAKHTRAFSRIATVLILALLLSISETLNLHDAALPLIFTTIAFYLAKHLQGKAIAAHIETGGAVFSWIRSIGIGLIGLLIMLIALSLIYLSAGLYKHY